MTYENELYRAQRAQQLCTNKVAHEYKGSKFSHPRPQRFLYQNVSTENCFGTKCWCYSCLSFDAFAIYQEDTLESMRGKNHQEDEYDQLRSKPAIHFSLQG